MSSLVDAVQKASQQREVGNVPPARSPRGFWAASAIFLVMAAGMAAVYFYEESKLSELQAQMNEAVAPLPGLKSKNEALLAENAELEKSVVSARSEQKQKIDELAGRAKVLQYEKETLESDVAAKEKKISALEVQIEKQGSREEELMSLIEQAKKQIAEQKAAAAAAKAVLPAAAEQEPSPVPSSSPKAAADPA